MTEQPTAPAPTAKGETTTVQPTRAQQSYARRIAEAKATIPDITLTAEVSAEADEPRVIAAVARALREVPRANASYRDAAYELYSRVNVGFTVITEEAPIVPTIFDAETKDIDTIAAERAALIERARSGEITAPELGGGTFTVVDLGAFAGSAIIHGGQAGILAFGTPAADCLCLTLTCDSRILYGAEATRFLGAIVAALV